MRRRYCLDERVKSVWKEKLLDYRKSLCLLLLPVFVFFIFAPLKIFLTNYSNFWFGIKIISVACMVCAVIFFILISIIYIVFPDKFKLYAKGFIWAISVALYVQGNIIPYNYGSLDGTPIDWKSYSINIRIFNAAVWIVIIAGLILVTFFFRMKNIVKIQNATAVYLILIQMVTLVVLAINYSPNEKNYYMSTKNEFNFAENKNIVVLVADSFETPFFQRALKEDSSLYDIFDGFTFFDNVIGTSMSTTVCMPTLLTGYPLLEADDTYEENINQSYSKTSLFSMLNEKGYTVDLYVPYSEFVSSSVSEKIDNFDFGELKITSNIDFCGLLYKMVSFIYMPHELKQYFWVSTSEFDDLKSVKSDEEVYTWSNLDFYNRLCKGITIDSTLDKAYKLYHIQGPHNPAVMDENCVPLTETVQLDDNDYLDAQYIQAVGTIKIFAEYINQLKKEGIYDNTTLIFTADHGKNASNPFPVLLVKRAGERGKMELSSAPISIIEDYLPSIMSFIEDNDEKYTTFFNLPIDIERKRFCYLYSRNAADGNYKSIAKYEHDGIGELTDYNAWNLTELDQGNKNYELGTTIYFTSSVEEKKQASNYCLRGINVSPQETSYTWTNGYEVKMKFCLNGEFDNLQLHMDYLTYHEKQQVRVYANDVLVSEFFARGEETQDIVITGNCVDNGNLIIKFEFPDASSPKANGESGDARLLALGMKSMTISAE